MTKDILPVRRCVRIVDRVPDGWGDVTFPCDVPKYPLQIPCDLLPANSGPLEFRLERRSNE